MEVSKRSLRFVFASGNLYPFYRFIYCWQQANLTQLEATNFEKLAFIMVWSVTDENFEFWISSNTPKSILNFCLILDLPVWKEIILRHLLAHSFLRNA